MGDCVVCDKELFVECSECGEPVHSPDSRSVGVSGGVQTVTENKCAKTCDNCSEVVCNNCWKDHKEGESE